MSEGALNLGNSYRAQVLFVWLMWAPRTMLKRDILPWSWLEEAERGVYALTVLGSGCGWSNVNEGQRGTGYSATGPNVSMPWIVVIIEHDTLWHRNTC